MYLVSHLIDETSYANFQKKFRSLGVGEMETTHFLLEVGADASQSNNKINSSSAAMAGSLVGVRLFSPGNDRERTDQNAHISYHSRCCLSFDPEKTGDEVLCIPWLDLESTLPVRRLHPVMKLPP